MGSSLAANMAIIEAVSSGWIEPGDILKTLADADAAAAKAKLDQAPRRRDAATLTTPEVAPVQAEVAPVQAESDNNAAGGAATNANHSSRVNNNNNDNDTNNNNNNADNHNPHHSSSISSNYGYPQYQFPPWGMFPPFMPFMPPPGLGMMGPGGMMGMPPGMPPPPGTTRGGDAAVVPPPGYPYSEGMHPGMAMPGMYPGMAMPWMHPGMAMPGMHPGMAMPGMHPGMAMPAYGGNSANWPQDPNNVTVHRGGRKGCRQGRHDQKSHKKKKDTKSEKKAKHKPPSASSAAQRARWRPPSPTEVRHREVYTEDVTLGEQPVMFPAGSFDGNTHSMPYATTSPVQSAQWRPPSPTEVRHREVYMEDVIAGGQQQVGTTSPAQQPGRRSTSMRSVDYALDQDVDQDVAQAVAATRPSSASTMRSIRPSYTMDPRFSVSSAGSIGIDGPPPRQSVISIADESQYLDFSQVDRGSSSARQLHSARQPKPVGVGLPQVPAETSRMSDYLEPLILTHAIPAAEQRLHGVDTRSFADSFASPSPATTPARKNARSHPQEPELPRILETAQNSQQTSDARGPGPIDWDIPLESHGTPVRVRAGSVENPGSPVARRVWNSDGELIATGAEDPDQLVRHGSGRHMAQPAARPSLGSRVRQFERKVDSQR